MAKHIVTDAQINAAYDVVHRDLILTVQQYVPPVFQPSIISRLTEPDTIRRVCQIINDAIEAASKA
jgi:hypothetical protein